MILSQLKKGTKVPLKLMKYFPENSVLCFAKSKSGYVCGRKKRHKGKHIAIFRDNTLCCSPWK